MFIFPKTFDDRAEIFDDRKEINNNTCRYIYIDWI